MGIGLPGSGKTLILRNFAERHKYTYISVDEVRAKFNLSPGEASTKEVWEEIKTRVREGLGKANTVVMDSTSVLGSYRRTAIEFARECGAEKIQGIFIDTPAEIARMRNNMRDQHAPENIFANRLQSLKEQPPSIEDGFDGLFTLDENQKLVKAEFVKERKELSRERPRFS